MQRIVLIAPSALMSIVILASCSKTGPAGAAGSTGPAGPAGNANVIYSAWTNGFSGTSADWAVSAITTGVVDSSAVLVYFEEGTIARQLPYDLNDGSGFFVNYDLTAGEIELSCGSNQDLSTYSFRYVIVPPGVAGTSVPRTYEEMMARLGIAP
jgi:hypothetical protein